MFLTNLKLELVKQSQVGTATVPGLIFCLFFCHLVLVIHLLSILKPLPNQQMHLNGKGSFKAVVLRRWGVKMSTFLFIYYLVYLPHTNKLQ